LKKNGGFLIFTQRAKEKDFADIFWQVKEGGISSKIRESQTDWKRE
jgi:hypothetical protein